MEKMKKIMHISIIIIGIIFISISSFHTSLWFDESYSVAIANKGFIDIWKITGKDVHPALYYWLLHFVNLIFGNNILMYRLFSLIAIAILGILGYTHIRKDFGEKTGIIFSYLTYFLPVMCTYSSEIRMYSWSCLFVTLMAIYGYRFYKTIKNEDKKNIQKNLIFFGIFSICSSHIHYYALVTAGLINLILLIYLLINREKNKKTLKEFLILASIQILLYIPWLIYLVGQLKHVNNGFWIEVSFIKTTIEVISLQFRRSVDISKLESTTTLIIAVLIYIYIIYKIIKERKELKPAIFSLSLYVIIIVVMYIISIILPILYSRYLVVITGMYIFGLSYIITKENNKIIITMILGTILVSGIICNIENAKNNYAPSNSEVYEYLKQELKQGDIIVYSDIVDNGGVIAAYFPEYKQYFINYDHWDVEEAYKAYSPGMEIVSNLDFIKNYTGRIWVVYSGSDRVYEDLKEENTKIVNETKTINTKYHDKTFNIMLVEKK